MKQRKRTRRQVGNGNQNKIKRSKKMNLRRRKKTLVITIPLLDEPRRSKSGKSVLIASSFGVRKSKLKIDGCNLLYLANAFHYPAATPGPASGETKMRFSRSAGASRKLRHAHKT